MIYQSKYLYLRRKTKIYIQPSQAQKNPWITVEITNSLKLMDKLYNKASITKLACIMHETVKKKP